MQPVFSNDIMDCAQNREKHYYLQLRSRLMLIHHVIAYLNKDASGKQFS